MKNLSRWFSQHKVTIERHSERLKSSTKDAYNKATELSEQAKQLAEQAANSEQVRKQTDKLINISEDMSDSIKKNGEQLLEASKRTGEVVSGVLSGGVRSVTDLIDNAQILLLSPDTKDLTDRIESQGSQFRELHRDRSQLDAIFLCGESLASLLSQGSIDSIIEEAYAAQYPGLAEQMTFLDKVRELETDAQLLGFISGVKGKLFELKYVDYLNDGNLPDGYEAQVVELANQPGWDIEIIGPNGGVQEILQAKATDSIHYVQAALDKYPSIDIVTTEEVYSQLVLAGAGDGVLSSGFTNEDITDEVVNAANAAELNLDFMPPVITMAFIAFTSFKEESLTLYQKARTAGERSGTAYYCYLLGNGVAVATNTWWLGVVGSVTSRYMTDVVARKAAVKKHFNKVIATNQTIIDRTKAASIA
ncbi:hypothetical protein [Agarivorans litoreus]|uniref:hypothetical protein n=1 Tax=Agarivorans litoreus TaxID=1510455 RepID=UPI001C7E126A|nr:hypothetical protein [Agarivorans litoreus]